jgi:hypothetical protein
MSKTDLDYANTIIYKITCKDAAIKDVYVGHTTNFVQRKHAHKQSCINPKSSNHTCKLYTIIREHGGWTNWVMEIVHFFNCNDQYEARTKEQEYFILLNATLNSVEPMPKPKPSIKTLPLIEAEPIVIENVKPYNCELCDYHTNNSTDYDRHVSTSKHIKRTLSSNTNNKNTPSFLCNNCNKGYKERSGLWRHSRKCHSQVINSNNNFILDKELLIIQLIKENNELKNMLIQHISAEKD